MAVVLVAPVGGVGVCCVVTSRSCLPWSVPKGEEKLYA